MYKPTKLSLSMLIMLLFHNYIIIFDHIFKFFMIAVIYGSLNNMTAWPIKGLKIFQLHIWLSYMEHASLSVHPSIRRSSIKEVTYRVIDCICVDEVSQQVTNPQRQNVTKETRDQTTR